MECRCRTTHTSWQAITNSSKVTTPSLFLSIFCEKKQQSVSNRNTCLSHCCGIVFPLYNMVHDYTICKFCTPGTLIRSDIKLNKPYPKRVIYAKSLDKTAEVHFGSCWCAMRGFKSQDVFFSHKLCKHNGFKNHPSLLKYLTFDFRLCSSHALEINLKKGVHVLLGDVSF